MSYLSWTRAAYVLFVLSILAALIKVSGLADPQSLASRPADAEPAEAPAGQVVAQQAGPEPASEEPASEEPASAEPAPAEAVPAEAVSAPTRYVVWESEDLQELENLGVPTTSEAVERVGGGDDFAQNEDSGDEPLVFYRPRPDRPEYGEPGNGAGGAAEDPARSGKVCGDLEQFPKSSEAVFPLSREHFDSYTDTWGAPRPQGSHEGVDLMVPSGTPEYAITDGTIVPVSGANGNGWNTLGGYTVMLQADYDVGPIKKGDLFYYAHMREASSLEIGTRVRAGQIVGYAGDTGEGPEGTRGLFPPHLHLGWYDTSGARTDLASGAMNPYPLLEWLKQNGGSVAGGSDAEYCEAPQSGAPTPSTGEGYWQYPDSPGTRPDMDTGADHARPSPVVPASATSPERAPVQQEVPEGNPDRPNRDVREGRDGARPDAPARDPRENGNPGDVAADLPAVRDEAPFYGDRLSDAIRRIAENPRDLGGAPHLREWLDGFVPGVLDGDRPERRERPDEETEDEGARDGKKAEPDRATGAERPGEPEKTNPVEEEPAAKPEAEEDDGSATQTQYDD